MYRGLVWYMIYFCIGIVFKFFIKGFVLGMVVFIFVGVMEFNIQEKGIEKCIFIKLFDILLMYL